MLLSLPLHLGLPSKEQQLFPERATQQLLYYVIQATGFLLPLLASRAGPRGMPATSEREQTNVLQDPQAQP